MNRDDQFEKRLQRQPLRQVPAPWRDQILAAAKCGAVAPHASRVTRHASWWRELFWPAPQAWAGLAAVWLAILTVNIVSRDASTAAAIRVVPPSPQMRQMLQQQEQLLAELVDEARTGDRPKTLPSRPHSRAREEIQNA